MKALFLSYLMIISIITIAQNQNTFPTTGNVGINTSSSPSERLHVNGNARVDSCLVVRDSAIVEKDLRTKGKLATIYVLGQAQSAQNFSIFSFLFSSKIYQNRQINF